MCVVVWSIDNASDTQYSTRGKMGTRLPTIGDYDDCIQDVEFGKVKLALKMCVFNQGVLIQIESRVAYGCHPWHG